ncbi:MAG: hypothetical protein AVDCRST_MAG73-1146 [uncultured Thermomicrobiales bacterium]|uniref:Glycosyltransferase n=1 Tax=uncultured Thermomicrobiales bacterium TaxID=1645740 RepID=A0A6J4TVT5_9BACT|nr:MAG: hypothetical protein AVDCRST_MAG73-1146 [uncultured Thermomicrobiales bacterium]
MTDVASPAPHPSGNLLLIAARAPVPGQTKTRLGAAIGMDRAAALAAAFLTDLARRFAPGDPRFALGWAFSPPEYDFSVVLATIGCPRGVKGWPLLVPQAGADWGERQANLLRWGAARGYARTVLIASDSPHLGANVPLRAFAALADHDVALGRVHDGGYYLIGLRGFHDVFSGVPMSTADAAGRLVERAHALGLTVAATPPTFDVDEEADLDRLRRALAPSGAAAPATWAALGDLGLR